MSDEAYALAATDAGITADYRLGGFYIPVCADDVIWSRLRAAFESDAGLLTRFPTPKDALAAAARALGLQPRWVVVANATLQEEVPHEDS